MEQWTPVPGYQGWYEVSDHGRARKIRRSSRGHSNNFSSPLPFMLTPLRYRKGYYKIHFATCDGTKPIRRSFLHRVVWEAFRGPIPSGMTINHIDGNPANNRLDNLELATPQEQVDHAIATGLRPARVLDIKNAPRIRALYRTGRYTLKDLARQFSVSESMISQIVIRRVWSRLNDQWFAEP